jgi:ATP-binding cassette subfamily B protein
MILFRLPFLQNVSQALYRRIHSLGNLRPYLGIIYSVSPALTWASMLLRLLRAVFPPLMLYIGKLIIDSIAAPASTDKLFYYVLAECALVILSDLTGRALSLIEGLLSDQVSTATSVQIMQKASTMDLQHFEDATFYDKLERARRQTNNRAVLLSQIFMQGQDIITLLFLQAGLLSFSPWLLPLVIIAVLPGFISESRFNARSYSLSTSWTPQRRELDYLRYIGASDETAKEIKLFNLSGFIIDKFRSLAISYYQANKALSIKRASWGVTMAMIGTLAYYAAYILMIQQAVNKTISIGDLLFLSGSFMRLRGLLESILGRFAGIAEGALYLQDLFDFLAMKPNIITPEKPRLIPEPIKQGFVFENVGFRYHGSEKWTLRHLNFELKAGEKLALVGENGAGKTTIVKLLTRLYDPTEGRILLDGVDLREYDPDALRALIGVIFQDYIRFQMKLGENIAVGNIDNRQQQALIQQAAVSSLADTVARKFDLEYDQMIGRRFAEGAELSGGEWQKVALARAYMRQAQLLVLDEPTSALDARAEHDVFVRFAELTQGKTAVLISHRFSTVRMANRIAVLGKGQVQEIGSHQELMEKNGIYAELFRLQASGYQ